VAASTGKDIVDECKLDSYILDEVLATLWNWKHTGTPSSTMWKRPDHH